MVAQARRALTWRTAGRALRAVFGWLALAIGLFFAAGWIGSSIPRNPDWREPAPNDPNAIEIMVETNGVHTALVLPLLAAEKDWRAEFPASDVRDSAAPYSHVSVSWGERRVFLDTPAWSDLAPGTVLRVLAGRGEGLLHVAHYERPAPATDIRPIRLTPAQYRVVVRRIEALLPPPDAGFTRRAWRGYADHDAFYDARGDYTVLNTCNQWTSDTLAAAGVRTGWWTPFAGGVMKWVGPSPPL